MKVDFHCHTIATKSGEDQERNVKTSLFKSKIEESGVQLVVITNHNHFDLLQFNELEESVADKCMLWPGVELDVLGNSGKSGHLVLIADPKEKEKFNKVLEKIIDGKKADEFKKSITEIIEAFRGLNIIYSPHFLKSKQLPIEDIIDIESKIENKNRLLWEPSALSGVGILNVNGYKAILGSDGHSWKKYEEAELGKLRFRISSFENFCKVLDKDQQVMMDYITQDFNKDIEVFGDFEKGKYPFFIPIYNDVNIIYGDKGSGKSEILKSLNHYFKMHESIEPIYYKSSDKDEWFSELLRVDWDSDKAFKIEDDCQVEFTNIASYLDETPTGFAKYLNYYKNKTDNKSIKKMKCLEIQVSHSHNDKRLKKLKSELETLQEFKTDIKDFLLYEISQENTLDKELNVLSNRYISEIEKEFVEQKASELFDDFVIIMQKLSSENTGTPSKPTETGFLKFARNRFTLERNATKILSMINQQELSEIKDIGEIGSKGIGILETKYTFLNSTNNKSINYQTLRENKTPLIDIISKLETLSFSLSVKTLNDKIIQFVNCYDNLVNKNISAFMSIKKTFKIKETNTDYNPSSGEKSILNLQYNLLSREDGEVFLIDEPELSLGGKYIEETIVPIINRLSRSKKIIVIATHNANLAVRTRPINSIYKTSYNNEYKTYTGSMFTDKIVNVNDETDVLSWIETSMEHLEGGEFAFEERIELYDRN